MRISTTCDKFRRLLFIQTIENPLYYPEIQPRKIQLQSRQSQIDRLESENQRIENSEDSCRNDLRSKINDLRYQKSSFTSLEEKYNLLVKSEFYLSCYQVLISIN